MEEEITIRGGGEIQKSEDIDPRLENQFLKNVLAFEEADKEEPIPMRSFFPEGYLFPPKESMSQEELSDKVDDISRILSEHNIEFGFANDLPDQVLYDYLVRDCIAKDSVSSSVDAGFTWVLDGCYGGCEDCFQREYCETGREMEG
ncbi:MAG: hypothetical protein JW913_18235 [Chitinispirillaceae bacterium]|nr:hypothetical protein [Chitinispirillaceae bacterium]